MAQGRGGLRGRGAALGFPPGRPPSVSSAPLRCSPSASFPVANSPRSLPTSPSHTPSPPFPRGSNYSRNGSLAPELTSLLLHKHSLLTAILGFFTCLCAVQKEKQNHHNPLSPLGLPLLPAPLPDSPTPAVWTLPVLAAQVQCRPCPISGRVWRRHQRSNLTLGTPRPPDYIQKFQVIAEWFPTLSTHRCILWSPLSPGFPASRPAECTVSLP